MSQTSDYHTDHRQLGKIIDDTPLTKVHYLALFLVVMGGLFEVMEQLILASLGPSLQEAFGIAAQDIAFLSTVSLLAIAAGGIAGGYVADKMGRRTVLAVSIGIYALGSVFAAFAPTYEVLAAARIVTGIGIGGEIAVGLTYLSELTPTRIRGLFVSLFNTISAGVGMFLVFAYTIFVLGPFADWIGAEDSAWRWAFGLLGVPAVLIFFIRRYLPETPRHLMEKRRREDLNRSLTRLAQGRINMSKTEEPVEYFSSSTLNAPADDIKLKASEHFGALFVPIQRKRTINLSVVAFLAWGAQFSIILLMPLLLVERGYTIGDSLAFTMIQNVGGLLGAITASIGAYHFQRRRMIAVGCIISFLAIAAFALFATTPFLIMLLGFAFNFGVMVVNTTIWTWSPELFPTKSRGLGTSMVVNIGFIGGAVIPLATAWIFGQGNELMTFGIVAFMYVGIFVISRFVTETHNRSFEELQASI